LKPVTHPGTGAVNLQCSTALEVFVNVHGWLRPTYYTPKAHHFISTRTNNGRLDIT
jgi:hypothetical protein